MHVLLLHLEEKAAVALNVEARARDEIETSSKKIEDLKVKYGEAQDQYNQLKLLLQQRPGSRTKRELNATTFEMINDPGSSTRYRRRQESKHIMTFLHGGEEGAALGAWDLLMSIGSVSLIDRLISGYKKGKYLQGKFNSLTKKFESSNESMKQALVIKYNNYMSCRKYKFQCRTFSSLFDANSETWIPRNHKVDGIDVKSFRMVSYAKLDRFVKSIDIGQVHLIPACVGVSRTLVSLVIMITDLHLRLPFLRKRLVWFNDCKNHFIFQFGDDGAPENSSTTMSIGTLTSWNFGKGIGSRDMQYMLHGLSVQEKDAVMADIWEQHTREMQLLEGNVFTINGEVCTFEFQPSADQCWQSWAANEVSQSATYPSVYANVRNSNIAVPNGKIGHTWQPPNKDSRAKHIKMVSDFKGKLDPTINNAKKVNHDKLLTFLAENGIRTLGPPRIGEYANRLRPEPLHCEINCWQDFLDLIYHECVLRGVFEDFIQVLQNPISPVTDKVSATNNSTTVSQENTGIYARACDLSIVNAEHEHFVRSLAESSQIRQNTSPCPAVPGVGLHYLSKFVREHYENNKCRLNKLTIRLIGQQVICLAHYHNRLVDVLKINNESEQQKIIRLVIGKIGQLLRDAGSYFNRINVDSSTITSLEDTLSLYYNLHALFFENRTTLSVWTLGCALPYHARILYEEKKVGYGIVSCQSKESKHACIKKELILTNRQGGDTEATNKWLQVFRAEFIKYFYIPEHCPQPYTYKSKFSPRVPPHCSLDCVCDCGRYLEDQQGSECLTCCESKSILDCATRGKLSPEITAILLPFCCPDCELRFSDDDHLRSHIENTHGISKVKVPSSNPYSMSKNGLKAALRDRGLDTRGNVATLRERLLGKTDV